MGNVIAQETEQWVDDITIDEEGLLNLITENIDLDNEKSFVWLKDLYEYLETNNIISLGEKYSIYLNEANHFCFRDELAIHPDIDVSFKEVSNGLGRNLDEEFLNRKLGQVSSIKTFDLNEFYNHLNKEMISELSIESATPEQIKAIFQVCSLFRSDKAQKRKKWYFITNQLLPDLTYPKRIISVDYEYFWRSAELWSIKYICSLIEREQKPSSFTMSYFDGHDDSFFAWMNKFLSFIFSLKEENRDIILKRNIIPTQADEFKSYDDFIFSEVEPKYFDNTIKDIYRDYTSCGEPRKVIVDNRITIEGIRSKEVDILTKEIDKLFLDPNIESKVKKGGSLNEMFLQLNNWFEQNSDASSYLTTFSTIRATLYVLALGEGFSKQIMDIQNSGKSIEDITELAKIKLSSEEMKLFESAATELGTDKLLAKAREMLDAKEQIERWKIIGKAAETSFQNALKQVKPSFDILNPDIGKDFVIRVNNDEYAIEIKSVEAKKGNVNMSILQGQTAVDEKDRYALAVVTRPGDNQPVDMEYFMNNAYFVPDIGYQIGNTITNWNQGLNNLDTQADLKVTLEDKKESVYISRSIWKNGIPFEQFVVKLDDYFSENYKKNFNNKSE